jgi:sodium/hydrogen exchanger 8
VPWPRAASSCCCEGPQRPPRTPRFAARCPAAMFSELKTAASDGLGQVLAVADPSSGINPWPVFTMFLALLVCLFCAVLLHKYHVHAVPESAVFILVGVIVGGINRAITPVPIAAFDASFFLTVLLPIIIFEAGFSVDKRSFFRNFGTINSLAVVGTLISTFVVGYGLYLFSLTGVIYTGKTALDPLLFGSILSAIDPVATLALFSSLQVDRTLYALVFGESVMNDAVAVAPDAGG